MSSVERSTLFDDVSVSEVSHAGTEESRRAVTAQVKPEDTGLLTTKAKDQLATCYVCNRRKVPFMPAFYCSTCIRLWFYLGEEAQRECTKIWHKDESLSPLELERIQWVLDHSDVATSIGAFADHIQENKPELLSALYDTVLRWARKPTARK